MIVITGATGSIGAPLVDLLTVEGVAVRAVTRDVSAAGLPAGVEPVEADPSRPETLDAAAALAGATALFLNPVAVQDAWAAVLDRARAVGVRRVVTLSGTNVDDAPELQPSRLRGARHTEIERALAASEFEWSALRANWFAGNALGLWAGQIRAGDTVAGPYADSAWSPVHELDVAAVAARSLTAGRIPLRRPELTGPESLTFARMVALIGEALGRPLRYREVSPEQAKRALAERGFPLPGAFLDRMFAIQAAAVGRPSPVSGDVERILGRPALSFAQWARDSAGAFAPAPAAAR